MSEHILETYIEPPIKVHFDAEKAERETRDSPGAPAQLTINSIEMYGIELPENLFQKIMAAKVWEDAKQTTGDELEQECWESLNEGEVPER